MPPIPGIEKIVSITRLPPIILVNIGTMIFISGSMEFRIPWLIVALRSVRPFVLAKSIKSELIVSANSALRYLVTRAMRWRIGILKEHGLGLKEIQETIEKIDPLPGAKEFLDKLRELGQVIIISDTFTQFAKPLMKKLGWPTIFCNSLEVAPDGEITGFKMRIEKSKYTTVKALQSIGFETIASGDSYNDLGMIEASKAGFLFRSTEQIKKDHPEITAFETYDELFEAIKKAMEE